MNTPNRRASTSCRSLYNLHTTTNTPNRRASTSWHSLYNHHNEHTEQTRQHGAQARDGAHSATTTTTNTPKRRASTSWCSLYNHHNNEHTKQTCQHELALTLQTPQQRTHQTDALARAGAHSTTTTTTNTPNRRAGTSWRSLYNHHNNEHSKQTRQHELALTLQPPQQRTHQTDALARAGAHSTTTTTTNTPNRRASTSWRQQRTHQHELALTFQPTQQRTHPTDALAPAGAHSSTITTTNTPNRRASTSWHSLYNHNNNEHTKQTRKHELALTLQNSHNNERTHQTDAPARAGAHSTTTTTTNTPNRRASTSWRSLYNHHNNEHTKQTR